MPTLPLQASRQPQAKGVVTVLLRASRWVECTIATCALFEAAPGSHVRMLSKSVPQQLPGHAPKLLACLVRREQQLPRHSEEAQIDLLTLASDFSMAHDALSECCEPGLTRPETGRSAMKSPSGRSMSAESFG